MPAYMLTDPVSKKQFKVTANRAPTQAEAANLLKEEMSKINVEPEVDYSGVAEGLRAAGQGVTFGFGDEIESGITAAINTMSEGTPYSENYRKRYDQLEDQREAFTEDYPKTALGAEIVGSLATGIAGAGRLGVLKGFDQLSKAGKAARLGGIGAVEGGIYGAGTANPDEILSDAAQGAAIGGVLAPVGAGTVNLLGDLVSGVGNFASRKLADTPRQQADRVLRQALQDEGLTPDQAVQRLADLNDATPGPNQATLTDLGESFRTQARAAMDVGDSAKGRAKAMVNDRQAGQRARVKTLIKKNFGDNAESFYDNFNNAVTRRSDLAAPLYNTAMEKGAKMTPDLEDFVKDPEMATIYNQAKSRFESLRKTQDYSEEENNLRVLDYLKQGIDGRMGVAKTKGDKPTVRFLQIKKQELLDSIAAQNQDYGIALKSFTDSSAVINAMEDGLTFLKKDPDLLRMSLQDLTDAEMDSFRMGAVRSLENFIEKQGDNTDVVKRLIGSETMRKRLNEIMDPKKVDPFLKGLGAETEFFKTKGAILGGPNTAERLKAVDRLEDEISPDLMFSLGMGDPSFLIPQVAKVLSKGKSSPELVEQLSDSLFDSGLTANQIIDIFSKPTIRKQLADKYDGTIAKLINKENVRLGIVPATQVAAED